nr:MAG TPA: Minor structural protein 4, Minor, Lactococcus lactis, Siphoviridae, nanobody [Caudoviricetes sp.]
MPTKNSDMYDTPDNYIGIYSGASSTAPTAYTSYTWFKYKGEKGDIGTPATITSQAVEY